MTLAQAMTLSQLSIPATWDVDPEFDSRYNADMHGYLAEYFPGRDMAQLRSILITEEGRIYVNGELATLEDAQALLA